MGAKGDWDFVISDLVKNPDGTDFNPCGEFRWSPEGPISQIHSPHLHVGAPGIFSDLLRYAEMLFSIFSIRERERERERVGAESNGKLPHLFIRGKTATSVTEFAVEDLALGRTLMVMMITL